MPRRKTDPLLSALISKLPAGGTEWAADKQKAWLDLMAMAFATVYGVAPSQFGKVTVLSGPRPPDKPAHAFVIDEQGIARKGPGGKRIKASDVTGPIFDMRGEDGDMRTITWADNSQGLNGADLVIVSA